MRKTFESRLDDIISRRRTEDFASRMERFIAHAFETKGVEFVSSRTCYVDVEEDELMAVIRISDGEVDDVMRDLNTMSDHIAFTDLQDVRCRFFRIIYSSDRNDSMLCRVKEMFKHHSVPR